MFAFAMILLCSVVLCYAFVLCLGVHDLDYTALLARRQACYVQDAPTLVGVHVEVIISFGVSNAYAR